MNTTVTRAQSGTYISDVCTDARHDSSQYRRTSYKIWTPEALLHCLPPTNQSVLTDRLNTGALYKLELYCRKTCCFPVGFLCFL